MNETSKKKSNQQLHHRFLLSEIFLKMQERRLQGDWSTKSRDQCCTNYQIRDLRAFELRGSSIVL